MRHANYVIEDDDQLRLVIKDVGPWDEHLTVTNDAEHVVEELASKLHGRLLFYWDSEDELEQLKVKDGKFAGFSRERMWP